MKYSLQKERQEDSYSRFDSKDGNLQLMPSPASPQEGRVLKAQVMYKGLGIAKILFSMLVALLPPIVIPLFGFGFSPSPTGPDRNVVIFDPSLSLILDIYLTLILYLTLLTLIFYNHNTVMLITEKIVIRRRLFNSFVLKKEEVTQISVSKNKGFSYRWPLRFLFLAALIFTLPQTVENITRDLSMETTPLSYKLIGVLISFWIVAFALVFYYIFELAAPYRQVLKITTRSNLNLELYIDEPEEILEILKKEK